MHCCCYRSMLGWPPTLSFPVCKASCCDPQLSGPSICPHCLFPAAWVSPCALLSRKQCVSTGSQLRAETTQRGRWCLVSTGDGGGVTQALPCDLPGQCQPSHSGQQLLNHKLFLAIFWAHCFDWQQSFWFPWPVSPECRLWRLQLWILER